MQVCYIPEATLNTTPATPVGITLRCVDFDPNITIPNVESKELRNDRQRAPGTAGVPEASPSIKGELSYGTLDDFLAAAMGSSWSPSLSGVNLAIDAAAKTLTRATGSFVTEGFEVGHTVTMAGFTNAGNNSSQTITAVTATVLTFGGATVLVTEASAAGRTVTGNILKVAGSVIKNNKGRKEKEIWTSEPAGDPVSVWSEDDEGCEARRCAGVAKDALGAGRSMAVLYRTNSQSRVLEEAMRRDGIPYVMIGGVRFYDRAEVKDALSWLRLLVNPRDVRALERASQSPRRGIGEKTIDQYRLVAEQVHGGDLVEALCGPVPEGVRGSKASGMGQILRNLQLALREEVGLSEIAEKAVVDSGLEAALEAEDTDEARERLSNLQELVSAAADFQERNPEGGLKGFLEEVALVSDADTKNADGKAAVLMTLHNSKGLEFDVVCLAGCEEGLFPLLRQDGGAEALEEERRLFYVGTTRARRKLHILNARVRTRFGVRDACIPSRFLDEMDGDAVVMELGSPRRSAFAGGELEFDEGGRKSFGSGGFRSSSRRPAFPPGALRSQDRAPTIRSTSGPAQGLTSRPASPPPQAFPDYESENQSLSGAFQPGMRVRHPKFGTGRVVKVHGSGSSARVDVQFGSETKRLVASMAGLVVIG